MAPSAVPSSLAVLAVVLLAAAAAPMGAAAAKAPALECTVSWKATVTTNTTDKAVVTLCWNGKNTTAVDYSTFGAKYAVTSPGAPWAAGADSTLAYFSLFLGDASTYAGKLSREAAFAEIYASDLAGKLSYKVGADVGVGM